MNSFPTAPLKAITLELETVSVEEIERIAEQYKRNANLHIRLVTLHYNYNYWPNSKRRTVYVKGYGKLKSIRRYNQDANGFVQFIMWLEKEQRK